MNQLAQLFDSIHPSVCSFRLEDTRQWNVWGRPPEDALAPPSVP